MKKVVILVIIIAAIILGVQYFKKMDKDTFTKHSETRVEQMLYGVKSRKTADLQESIGYWYSGNPKIPVSEQMANSFEDWRKKKGIFKVDKYEVLSATLINGDDQVNRYVEVRCRVNGKELGIKVAHKKTMRWLE